MAILELEPKKVVDDLHRVRVLDEETKKRIMCCDTREAQVEALIDYLADQPASQVLRPYANALKKHSPFLYALLNVENKSPYTANIVEVNLSKVSSLTDMPVAEEDDNDAPDMDLLQYRRGSLPPLHFHEFSKLNLSNIKPAPDDDD